MPKPALTSTTLSPMRSTLTLVMVLLAMLIDDRHRKTIDDLRTENRVLREQLRGRRLPFTEAQRRRLASAARASGLGLTLHAFSDTGTERKRPPAANRGSLLAFRRGGLWDLNSGFSKPRNGVSRVLHRREGQMRQNSMIRPEWPGVSPSVLEWPPLEKA